MTMPHAPAARLSRRRVAPLGGVDTMGVRARRGGPCWSQSGRPRQARSKLHLLTDAAGLPLAVTVTAANTPDGRCWPLWWMTFRRSGCPLVGGASCQPSSMPTRPTTARQTSSAAAPRDRATHHPGAESSPPSGLAATAGRSSAPCRGWVAGDGCRCGGTGTRGGFRLRVGGLCHRLLQPAVSSHRNDTPSSSYSCC